MPNLLEILMDGLNTLRQWTELVERYSVKGIHTHDAHIVASMLTHDVSHLLTMNRQVIYTPGVRYLADAGRAYWMIDAIASYFGSPEMNAAIARDPRIGQMQFWRLEVSEEKAVLTAEADAGEVPFIRQEIPYTDFPLKQVDIWAGFDGIYWTLYLPSEH